MEILESVSIHLQQTFELEPLTVIKACNLQQSFWLSALSLIISFPLLIGMENGQRQKELSLQTFCSSLLQNPMVQRGP